MRKKITNIFRIIRDAFFDIKEAIFKSNIRKKECEYTALTPVDNIEDGVEYFNAFKWALKNEKIKNIALAGPYGSGKSSIIDTFLKNNPTVKRESLRISMATFEKEKDGEKISFLCEDIEKEILKQLFYKVNHKRIPRSRYRKLYKISSARAFIYTCLVFTFLLLIAYVFWPEFFNTTIEKIVAAGSTFNISEIISKITAIGILIILALFFSKLYVNVFSHFVVKDVKLQQNISVENKKDNKENIFNKNLDEIVYFFEETKYKIVFFEDFDRLDEPTIFVELRELNNVLNNCDEINNNIIFVYAVRDDLFKGTERTKFFDFIIPVVPIINSTNSGEILIQKLAESEKINKKHNISQDFILDVSPYISDMRVLQNIYNEFLVYKSTLNTEQDLELLDEPMLALMIFKNLYPKDFADLQNETGIIKQAFDDKTHYIKAKKAVLQTEIDERTQKLNSIKVEYLVSERELKTVLLSDIVNGKGFAETIYLNNISLNPTKFLDSTYDVNLLKNINTCYGNCRTWTGATQSFNCSNFHEKYTEFLNRLNSVKMIENNQLSNAQKEIEDAKKTQQRLGSYSLSKLIESYGTESVLSSFVKDNKLLVFLLRRGYIDEKYVNYINYFKGNTVTSADMNFILSVKNMEPKAFEHKLNKIEMIVQKLQMYEFEQKAIYNFDLLNYLLSTDKHRDKLNVFIEQLSDESEISFSFIDSFVDSTPYRNQFFELLIKKWSGLWDYIETRTFLTYDRKCNYLSAIIANSAGDSIIAINSNGKVVDFFTTNKDIFIKLSTVSPNDIIAVISKLGIIFYDFDIYGINNRILDYIFDNNYYAINQCMIERIVEYKNKLLLSDLNTANYSTLKKLEYSPLLHYIEDNIDYYTSNIVLNEENCNENINALLDLLRLNIDNQNNANGIICKSNFYIDSFKQICLDLVESNQNVKYIWDTILLSKKIKITWENIYIYWRDFGFTDSLIAFIEENTNKLAEENSSCIDDEEFVYAFIKSNVNNISFDSLITKVRVEDFKLALSDIDETKIRAMINKGFLKFSVELFNEINTLYPELSKDFILKNQTDYMDVHNQINMDEKLLEFLISSTEFSKENTEKLLAAYASLINNNIATFIVMNHFDINLSVFKHAWEKLDLQQKKELMFKNLSILSAKDFETCFSKLDKPYSEFSDRKHRIEVYIDSTTQNIKLAERLKETGYITSYIEKARVIRKKGKGKFSNIMMLACKIKVVNST